MREIPTVLAQAVAALRTERDQVAARLARLDEAIATLRQIDGVTPDVPAPTRRRASTDATGERRQRRRADEQALLAALPRAGTPVAPREILRQVFRGREAQGRAAARRLTVSGAIIKTGAAHGSRWRLPTKTPAAAKEAP